MILFRCCEGCSGLSGFVLGGISCCVEYFVFRFGDSGFAVVCAFACVVYLRVFLLI